jgi:myosin-5
MEVGAHVWLRSDTSRWGWVPAQITRKEEGFVGKVPVIHITVTDDPMFESTDGVSPSKRNSWDSSYLSSDSDHGSFETVVTLDPEQLKTGDHNDIKLRNLSRSYQLNGGEEHLHHGAGYRSPSSVAGQEEDLVVGGVDDLIGLTHLHEPAILHALRLRYDADIIYTSTGPILIAVNPFKEMPLYTEEVMTQYRIQGEQGTNASALSEHQTPFKRRTNDALIKKMGQATNKRLPPHAYQIADDAYRAMMRGMENKVLMHGGRNGAMDIASTNQSILVSGESGAGKTVTTKIVLNYLAMLSKVASTSGFSSPGSKVPPSEDGVCIEQQVLQSNPILESFGNARTIRNDNSSRFGKYIDIRFSSIGKLTGASIETYLLEKVRLIHPGVNERNYHIFYEFLSGASREQREQFGLDDYTAEDFRILSQTGEFGRRDGVSDRDNHHLMLDAMSMVGFRPEQVQSLMRLIVGILFAGNMIFTAHSDDSCSLDEDYAANAAASLLGVSFEDLASALTSRTINTVHEKIEKSLTLVQAEKAREALIKAIYGAAFDFIVKKVNTSIHESTDKANQGQASIGVLDIFGFETFASNNFEQLCINYTNEALQQQFNKYVFKLEQLEYEKEGILWKYIAFPDNQDVLDLIDKKHTGILAILDEQCIVPQSTDEKFTRYLYSKCDVHKRFSASSAQRVDHQFSINHYAGYVEYTTENWLEKNKDELPMKSAELLKNSNFKLLTSIQKYVRSEGRKGRGTVITKSVGSQFSAQLKTLRLRIDETTPHYIRCLKPNDELTCNKFEPRNIVEQLRCGGVLEAVRVSRAGYPTRYPHDVFLARYYILGKSNDDSPTSPIANIANWFGSKEEKLKKLISKVAYEIFEADQQMLENIREAERAQNDEKNDNPKPRKNSNRPVYFKGSSIINGPQSLAVESFNTTPPEKRNQKKKGNILSLDSMKARVEHTNNLARPETREEFMSLDFVSRCAVAGIQLGKTKVFLRREAFDRIESLRSGKFFGSAVMIQSMIRGKMQRIKYHNTRTAILKLQYAIRRHLSKVLADRRGVLDFAATVIQRSYRNFFYRKMDNFVMHRSACIIQARARGIHARNIFYTALFGFIRLQAIHRGRIDRKRYLNHIYHVKAATRQVSPVKEKRVVISQQGSDSTALVPSEAYTSADLYRYIHEQDWANVEKALDKNPTLAETVDPTSGELPLHVLARAGAWNILIDLALVLYPKALVHRDKMGALPIHHAAAHNNVEALHIIWNSYKDGITEVDAKGRLPLHVAAEFDAVDAVKFLIDHHSEGAFTMVYRPADGSGGGLPLHVACRNYASIGVITALLAENFSSAKRTDENGDLPLHLLLKCGEVVDQVVVKTLLTCFSGAASRTDMNGDLPLSIALKNRCKSQVMNSILIAYPNAASTLNSEGQSPLHIAFENNADDRTILGLLNHAPEMATVRDKKTGLLPIQVATANEHSHFIVHNLLRRDMPIDLEERVRAQLLPHNYSWNHILSDTNDLYHQVVTKILHQCTQPQVLALAHIDGPDGRIALATASTVCKHELRVMLRLFNTLEVVNQRPAYTNPISDTQIFYALRYEPPVMHNNAFTIIHEEKKENASGDYFEDFDDASVTSALSRISMRSSMSSRSQQSVDEKLRKIRKEKGQQVIAKLTSRSDVVERELKVRKDFHLSRHYVPAIISVHHTVQHAAYSEAMAEPGYCITMEGADTTAENLMLDLRKLGKPFPTKALKRIGISLLHMHEHGLVHCDFGTHNIGKFGNRWKLLGVGGSVPISKATDPNRGFYHPPEAIVVENKRGAIGKKAFNASVLSIAAYPTYDMWAFGVVVYEAICGHSLSAYACRGKRAMSSSEVAKIGMWDDHSLRKALRNLPDNVDENAQSLIIGLLHWDPAERFNSMREVLEHSFFSSSTFPPQDVKGSIKNQNIGPTMFDTKHREFSRPNSTHSMSDSSPSEDGFGPKVSVSRSTGHQRTMLSQVDENLVFKNEGSPSMSKSSSKGSKKLFRNPFKKEKQKLNL